MSTATDNTDMLEHARALARHGLHVFPLREGGKLPAIKAYPSLATQDVQQIEEWWARWPAANIGVSTSQGLLVVDVDRKDGKRGEQSIVALELEGYELPETLTQTTASGGQHLIYSVPEAVKQGTEVLGPGLDIRSSGGYVVGAGSVIDGRAYTSNEAPIVPAPQWLVERCGQAPERDPRHLEPVCELDTEETKAKARYYLENEAELAVEGAGGNSATYRVAAHLKDMGLTADTARDLMFDHWNERCSPPWHYDDLQEPVDNAYRYGNNPPGSRSPQAQFQPVTIEQPAPVANLDEPIKLSGGDLPQIVTRTEAALIAADAGIYQRGGQLVRIANADPGGIVVQRPEGAPVVVPVDKYWLADAATHHCKFQKHDARSGKPLPKDCPYPVAATLIARSGDWKFPTLRGIVQAPTLRQDGTLITGPGIDVASGLLIRTDMRVSVSEQPDHGEALAALAILREPFAEFPFQTLADEAVALSAVLTTLIRPTLPAAPLHVFSSPTAGTGKSLLGDVAGVLATGRPIPTVAQGNDDSELEKRIGAVLLEGDPVCSIDNIERPLRGDFLCQALTQPSVKVRVLGLSKNVNCPTSLALFATGNNCRVHGDLVRRSILCRMNAGVERPDAREFRIADLRAFVANNRERLVSAALTILRAHFVVGQPFDGRPLGSFEAWSTWVRGSLMWLGLPDPVETTERLRDTDPQHEALARFLTAWQGAFGSEPTTVRKCVDRTFHDPALKEAAETVAGSERGPINSRRLGRWVARNEDVIVDGVAIRRAEGVYEGSALWQVA